MEYSIQETARAAGTTSRTLRHYDSLGLVRPSRVGGNGYRFYDDRALVRLQRVLLLRELGLGLDRIAEVLAAQDARGEGSDPAAAEATLLTAHLELLTRERGRIDKQIGAVRRTIAALTSPHERTGLMNANMFEGFDHTAHREEVSERWGRTPTRRVTAGGAGSPGANNSSGSRTLPRSTPTGVQPQPRGNRQTHRLRRSSPPGTSPGSRAFRALQVASTSSPTCAGSAKCTSPMSVLPRTTAA